MAGYYEHAAEVYAEGRYFYECLYACSEGELFDLGLRYIRSWKQQENFSKPAEARIDLIASEQKFLHKCALASHKQLDNEAMMKHVKDFSSLKSMRTFLKELGCFGELIELELEYGNHLEVVKIARHIGNILLEAEMLEKTEYCEEASRLYLAYVFASSLWADGSKGWPLKEFPSKKDLLSKAKANASKCLPPFYEMVCEIIQLLSSEEFDLRELEKLLALSVKHQNLRGEIMSARRILDKLLGIDVSMYNWERIPLKEVIYHWNFWKEKIETIFKYLEFLKVQGTFDYRDYEDFCLEYLGVRKKSISQDAKYSLLYPNAEWVKYVPKRSDKMESVSAHQLAYAAESYWCAELLSVGMKLLKLLESFRNLAVKSSLPVYRISQTLIHIFEAAHFLLAQCRYLKRTDDVYSSLMNYIDLSAEEYFLHVFSLHWRNTKMLLSKDLRFRSTASRNLLKEAILKRFMVEVVDAEGTSPMLSQVIQASDKNALMLQIWSFDF